MRLLFVALGLLLFSSGGALADAASGCDQEKDQDLKIRSCTLIIEGRAKPGYTRYVAYNNRCFAYDVKGDYGRAVADCNEAIRLKPNHVEAYNNRCWAYNGKGEYERAIVDCNEAIRLKLDNATAYNNRGNAYLGKGDYDRAIADYNEAIRLKPDNATAYNNRCLAYTNNGDHDRAIADCNQGMRLKPDAAAYVYRGVVYANKGDYDRAFADYNEAIRLKPDNATAYNNRCSAYNGKGDHDRAIADCNEAIRLKPDYAVAYNNRALARIGSGKAQEAKPDADKAVALGPALPYARSTRGLVLLAQGDAKAAQDDFNEALRLQADNIKALWGRGQAYERQGLRSLALADYKKAIELKAPTAYSKAEYQEKARARLSALETPLVAQAAAPSSPVAPPATSPVVLPSVAQAQTGRRVALVIGNSAYKSVSALTNPANDAGAIAQELSRLGFEVIEKHDLGADAMRRTLAEFENKATGADWALVYYAGHGMELNGRNWLIPVDAQLAGTNDVPDETVPLDRVLDRVHAAKRLRIVILDACRNNPFLSRMAMTGGKSRDIDRGLARIEPEHGEVVFYAARDGSVAGDGASEHSPFAAALLKHMEEEGVELGWFFRKVTSTVLNSTNPKQEPFVYGRLPEEQFYFKPPK